MQESQQPLQPASAGEPSTATPMLPGRGGAVLALGIIGIVFCFITGIIAWVMGKNDLREMDAGLRSRDDYSLTKAGMICGIVSVAMWALGLLWFVFVIVLTGTLGVLGC
jgi:hypothetical protein